MKKLLVLIMTLSFLIVPHFKVRALSAPPVSAEGAILIDANTGQVLYEKNPDSKFEPASTTKILTALITLEKTKLTDKVIVGNKPAFEDGSKIYTLEGEEFTVEQLLYALLLESANDSALALAEHVAGSKENFAKMMNDRAKEIGCVNTNFTNPNGLPDTNHYTTARDLALIAAEAMKNPDFRKIVGTKTYQIPQTNKQALRNLTNHNKLILPTRYKYDAADGIKTGFTVRARHTFVGSATKDGHRLIAVMLKSENTYYNDVQNLFEYGFNNFSFNKILSKDNSFTNITIKDPSKKISVYPGEDIYYTSPKSKEPVVTTETELKSSMASISKGEIIGYVSVSVDNKFLKKVPLISSEAYNSSLYTLTLNKDNVYDQKMKSSVKYLSAGSAFGLFIVSGFYRKIRKQRKNKRNNAYKNSRIY